MRLHFRLRRLAMGSLVVPPVDRELKHAFVTWLLTAILPWPIAVFGICRTAYGQPEVRIAYPLTGVNSARTGDFSPTLSPDHLELYFMGFGRLGGSGDSDLWKALRSSTGEYFSNPAPLGPRINQDGPDANPDISGDGLVLFFDSQKRQGGVGERDIWMMTRASLNSEWNTPVLVPGGVNSTGWEGRPSVTADMLVMAFDTSHDRQLNTIHLATRTAASEPFGAPVDLGIVGASPGLSADGLALIFMGFDSDPIDCDIYLATRPTRNDQFGTPVQLGTVINTDFCEADPDISLDGSMLFFSRTDLFRNPASIDSSFLQYADLWETSGVLGGLAPMPTPLVRMYSVLDDDSDGMFDGMGDTAQEVSLLDRRPVGEVDDPTANRLVRLAAKFQLPTLANPGRALERAVLRFFMEDIVGVPTGAVSVFHGVGDNDLDMLASDYEDPGYVDTLLDLVSPTNTSGRYYEVDVTDLVLADYAADGSLAWSAFRLQINEAAFMEDDEGARYVFTMPGAEGNHPELVLMFVPEPGTLVLAVTGVWAWCVFGFRWCRAA